MTAKQTATVHDVRIFMSRIFMSRSFLASGGWRRERSPRISPPRIREGIYEERRALRQLRKPGGPYGRDWKDVLLALFVVILDANAWV